MLRVRVKIAISDTHARANLCRGVVKNASAQQAWRRKQTWLIDPGGNFHAQSLRRCSQRPSRCKFNEFGILAAEKFPSAATTKVVAHTVETGKFSSLYTHQIKTCREWLFIFTL
jgi:hypothetical protein